MRDLTNSFTELIRRASTDLPTDVEKGLRDAQVLEEPDSIAQRTLAVILENVRLARANSTPICQDTGTPVFAIFHPRNTSTQDIRRQIELAVEEATRRSYLRPNAVNAVTGRNSGNNVGVSFPVCHFTEWDKEHMHVRLLLKGGGSENVSTQYKLPHLPLKAARGMEGVRRVVLDAVHQAQARGCTPGVLGIGLGGDRATGHSVAKEQLFRSLSDVNPVPELAALEKRLVRECNALGIGPMGFGGRTTVLAVKIGACHRLPACFFVSVAIMCWACRRASVTIRGKDVEST